VEEDSQEARVRHCEYLVLDVLAREELALRGNRFVAMREECNIYVRSETRGQRGDGGDALPHAKKLKLKVKRGKECGLARTAGTQVHLGFISSWSGHQAHDRAAIYGAVPPPGLHREIHAKSQRAKHQTTMEELAPYRRGWQKLFRLLRTPEVFIALPSGYGLRDYGAAMWRQWEKHHVAVRAALSHGGLWGNCAIWPAADVWSWHLAGASPIS